MTEEDKNREVIRIKDIRIDGGTQPRESIDRELVKLYAERMNEGDLFPPVEVYYDNFDYWLVNGYHRLEARKLNEEAEIEAYVFFGSKEQAQWDSYAANKDQDIVGSRRTNNDKVRAVRAALRHPLADKKSDNEIADHVGVSNFMVNKYRKLDNPSAIESQMECKEKTKTVTRNGKTFEMKVENINKGRKEKPAFVPTPDSDFPFSEEKTPPPTSGYTEVNKILKNAGLPTIGPEETENQTEEETAFDEEQGPQTHLSNNEPKGIGLEIAEKAIALLQTIPKKDKERTKAFNTVASWIYSNS